MRSKNKQAEFDQRLLNQRMNITDLEKVIEEIRREFIKGKAKRFPGYRYSSNCKREYWENLALVVVERKISIYDLVNAVFLKHPSNPQPSHLLTACDYFKDLTAERKKRVRDDIDLFMKILIDDVKRNNVSVRSVLLDTTNKLPEFLKLALGRFFKLNDIETLYSDSSSILDIPHFKEAFEEFFKEVLGEQK